MEQEPMAFGPFTDDDVTAACNLHVDNLRRLITWRAVRPIQSGGGRGKVRLWSLRQAQRIAVTALFANSGMSLRMAHTLAHCLPIDDMLLIHQPAFYAQLTVQPDLFAHEPYEAKDNIDLVGHVTIIDGRFVFGDILGDEDTLFGEIDQKKNIYISYWDPFSSYYGNVIADQADGDKASPMSLEIDRGSLLVEHDRSKMPTKDITLSDAQFFTSYNMYVCLAVATRRLIKLPIVNPIHGD